MKTVGHTGVGFASVSSSAYCNYATISQYVTAPPPNGAAGGAVKFWYKTSTMTPIGSFTFSASFACLSDG